MGTPFGGESRFGAHEDVMSAQPEDEASKTALVEEIKNRARAVFASQNFPVAEMLYGKAISTRPDATLYSNRAAARLGLGKHAEALHDAEEALKLDGNHTKSLYRRGQALLNLGKPSEALAAFEAGAKLEPGSKVWGGQIAKAKKAIEDHKSRPTPSSTASSSSARSTPASSAKSTPVTQPKKAASNGVGTSASAAVGGDQPRDEDGDEEMTDAAQLRGYRKTADGRVTTYFHKELTAEEKALIGNIAPQRMDVSSPDTATQGRPQADGISAWNQAGTWEERDMTSWCSEHLTKLLTGVEVKCPGGVIEITAVKDLKGDAQITFSRGKKRYLYDFNCDVEWEVELDCGPAKGKVRYPDISYDSEGDYECQVTVDNSTPPGARAFIDQNIRADTTGLRPALLARLNQFVQDFQQKG